MFNDSNLIQNRILEAFLNALQDVIDIDGKYSIIEHAKLSFLNDKLPLNGFTSIDDFTKLIESMNFLLVHSDLCIYEIGRKFSFYLSPFGISVEGFIEILKSLSNLASIELENSESGIYIFTLKSCKFCKGNLKSKNMCAEDIQCEFFEGFFSEFIKKNAKRKFRVESTHLCIPDEKCLFKFHIKEKYQ